MRAQAITLILRCKTDKGWRRYPAASHKGKIRPHCAMVPVKKKDGLRSRTTRAREEHHPEGTYEIRTYQGSDTVYQQVGEDPVTAWNLYDRARKALSAQFLADDLGLDLHLVAPGMIPLATYLDKIVEDKEKKHFFEAAQTIRICGEDFLSRQRRGITPEEVTAEMLDNFLNQLIHEGYARRTARNRLDRMKQILRATGIQVSDNIRSLRAPKPEEKLPEYFTKAQRDAFFAACRPGRETLIFRLAATLGLRDQELMFLEPSDCDFESMTVTVRSKDESGFRIKDGAERRITLRDDVAKLIRAYAKANPGIRWLTCRADGEPDRHLLRLAKRIGERAGLTCRVFLHKFRSTYCTQLLRENVDIRTVQTLMGHEDLETTIRYLRAIEAEDKELRKKVNKADL